MSDAGMISKSKIIPPLPERSTNSWETLQAIGNSPIQRTCSDFSNRDILPRISSVGSLTINAESGRVSIIGKSCEYNSCIKPVISTLLD